MKIRKAIITAAGENHARLPLQTLVDRRGEVRTALRYMLDEVIEAGIDDVALIIRPGQAEHYVSAAGPHSGRIVFFEQDNPRGYGDALLRARSFVDGEACLHLVSDHLFLSRCENSCVRQLIDAADHYECAVSAIQPTRENEVTQFGAVGGVPLAQAQHLYEVSTVIEKPTPTVAEQKLIVAGQRAGYYLCMFGMHVLTARVFELLERRLASADPGESIDLSSSLNQLLQSERYLALVINGSRYNISERYGLLKAQLALTLSGDDRDLLLTELIRLLSEAQSG
ncbi:MAG: hypothetical protein R3C19_03390 [Planctomycetaceae bacterium]